MNFDEILAQMKQGFNEDSLATLNSAGLAEDSWLKNSSSKFVSSEKTAKNQKNLADIKQERDKFKSM